MPELLAWLEGSAFGQFVRGSGVWVYSIINLAHVLGLSTLFGSVLVLDLRLLGFWKYISIAAIARPTVPLAATGFAAAAGSGFCMLAVNGSEYAGNPFLYVKFPAIAFGIVNVAVLQFLPAWKARATRELTPRERRHLAVAGAISLLCWITAITAGRMIAYW
jgi:hypothetical protein